MPLGQAENRRDAARIRCRISGGARRLRRKRHELVNGRIFTVEAAQPWAEAVAIAGDRITHVGSSADVRALAGPRTRVIDLRGAFASPGFNDGHVHVDSTGALLLGANLLDVHEPKAFTERIREAAARMPAGSWITRGDWGAYEQWSAGSAGRAGGAGAAAAPFTPHRDLSSTR
jgi:predicted amidohydrolase YtcJ